MDILFLDEDLTDEDNLKYEAHRDGVAGTRERYKSSIPASKAKKSHRGRRNQSKSRVKRVLRGWEREVEKMIAQALENIVRHDDIDLEKHLRLRASHRTVGSSSQALHHDARRCRIGVDKNGLLLYIIFPWFMAANSQNVLESAFGRLMADPITKRAGKPPPDSDIHDGDALAHQYFFSAAWTAPGWTHRQFQPSRSLDKDKDSKCYEAGKAFISDISCVLTKINYVIEKILPTVHSHMTKAMSKIMEHPPSARAHEGNPSLFPNMALLCNRQTGLHYDRNCNLNMFDASLTAGTYDGGDFSLPELGLTLAHPPGSLCIFRGRAFRHGVKQWTGPSRKCVCLWYAWSVLQQLGLKDVPQEKPIL